MGREHIPDPYYMYIINNINKLALFPIDFLCIMWYNTLWIE